ncbi:MAG: response regulator [Bacteroidota bacterium]
MEKRKFIIVDDDPFNNKICSVIIKNFSPESEVITFVQPEVGFDYIAEKYKNSTADFATILLLDINMPTMNGWEFLEKFEKLDIEIKKKISVFILSSSVDQSDMDRSKDNKYVCDYISKPLSSKAIEDAIKIISTQ